MVDVGMSPMPLKVIERKTCLRVRGPSRLSMDLGPQRHPNIKKEGKIKGHTWEFMKVRKEGVQLIDMMAVVHNNELKFQKLSRHHHV